MANEGGTGQRRRLSRAVILASALEIAEREGLEAVTVRRLAAEQQVTPMALYRHFSDKEAIFDALAEKLFAQVRIPAVDGRDPTSQLRDLLRAVVDAFRPTPVAAGLTTGRIFASTPGLQLAECALGLLRAAGFDTNQSAELARYLLRAAIALATTDSKPAGAKGRGPDDARRALTALDPDDYPNLTASARALVPDGPDTTYYEHNIDLLIEGLDSLRGRLITLHAGPV